MTSVEKPSFEIPRRLEATIATLANHYRRRGEAQLQNILVNAQYTVEEGWTRDNWDGGTWGHAIQLTLPLTLYLEVMEQVADIESRLSQDLNKILRMPGEYIDQLRIGPEDASIPTDWREKSGLLVRSRPTPPSVPEKEVKAIWEPDFLRAFLSHKSEFKKEAASLRDCMLDRGVSCFVAHEDIEPTKEWQEVIENALFSMDVMIPLITEKFPDSKWTDQEVGIAIGRGIPVVPVRLGRDPYGFIGKFQALNGSDKRSFELADDLLRLLIGHASLRERSLDALVTRFERAFSFDDANRLMKILETLEWAPAHLVERIAKAPELNPQVRAAFRVRDYLGGVVAKLKAGKGRP